MASVPSNLLQIHLLNTTRIPGNINTINIIAHNETFEIVETIIHVDSSGNARPKIPVQQPRLNPNVNIGF